jgi:hypothetical protein
MKSIGSMFCKQYKSEAQFFIDESDPSRRRHLFVQYAKGGYGGALEFAAAIPDSWSEQDVMDLIFWPMNPKAPYPAWEVPARAFGSVELFRWANEKPPP